MAKFTVRIELHGASRDSEAYKELHEAMEENLFKRTVKYNGIEYHLLTAEYSINGDYSIQLVTDLAKEAAKKTGKAYSIAVHEYIDSAWVNLTPI